MADQHKSRRASTGFEYLAPDGVIYYSKSELCKAFGVSYYTFNQRIKRGMSISEALVDPEELRKAAREEKAAKLAAKRLKVVDPVTGERFRSKQEMCEAHGRRMTTVCARLKMGWTLEKALTTPERARRKQETYQDHLGVEYKDFKTMCTAYGKNSGTVKSRLDRGYTLEAALTSDCTKAVKADTPKHEPEQAPTSTESEDNTGLPERYAEFVRIHGYTPASNMVKDSEESKLGTWAVSTKHRYTKGTLGKALTERVEEVCRSVLHGPSGHGIAEVPVHYWRPKENFGASLGCGGQDTKISSYKAPSAKEVYDALQSIYGVQQAKLECPESKVDCGWITRILGIKSVNGLIAHRSLGFTAEIMQCFDPTSDKISVGLLAVLGIAEGGLAELCFSNDVVRFQLGARVKREVTKLNRCQQLAVMCHSVYPNKYVEIMEHLNIGPQYTWESTVAITSSDEFKGRVLRGDVDTSGKETEGIQRRNGVLLRHDIEVTDRRIAGLIEQLVKANTELEKKAE